MTISALVTGSLFRRPEQRRSRNDRAYVTTTVKAAGGNEVHFVNVVAFSESAQAELLRLGEGDAVSVQGPFKAEVYEREGQTRVSLSITADCVLAARQPPKERTKKPATVKSSMDGGSPPFDDEIGF
jgi:single-stranded DNA-binding protein